MRPELIVLQTAGTIRSDWIHRCLLSVEKWAAEIGAEYHFAGDEIRALVPEWVWSKTADHPQAGFDLLRLVWIEEELRNNPHIKFCLWLDADVFVTDPGRLRDSLPMSSPFAVGRENWVECHDDGSFNRLRRHVHNAALWADRENPVLPFYRFAAERILKRVVPPFVPQLVGPKLLTSWHNVIDFDVLESCTMISPALANSILNQRTDVVAEYLKACKGIPGAVNLCTSMMHDEQRSMELIDALERW